MERDELGNITRTEKTKNAKGGTLLIIRPDLIAGSDIIKLTITDDTLSDAQSNALENVYDYIIESQPENLKNDLTFFQETDQEMIESYYPGLSDISLKQENIYTPAIIGFAQEIALVEVENSNDVDKVKEIFNKRIEDCKNSVACDPEINELWATNAEVQVSGNFVAMIALPEGYIIPNNVFANL